MKMESKKEKRRKNKKEKVAFRTKLRT